MWRTVASNALTVLTVGLFLLAGVILWGRAQYTARGPLETAICVKVDRGANLRRVSRQLEAQGAISNGTIFRIGAEYAGKADDLKAGSFLIDEGASMAEIVDVITRGGASTCGTEIVYRIGVRQSRVQVRALDPESRTYRDEAVFVPGEGAVPAAYVERRAEAGTRYRVSMAEGVTSWQVVEALRAFDVLVGDVPEVPAEGMLAPDSYEVTPGMPRLALLARMEERQRARLAAAWEGRQEGLPLKSPEELLILASIIEKETGLPEERRQVASVFVNRLKRGMRLQTDPTVIYGITKGRGVLNRGLRQSELRRPTPWNTYVIDGLPPTPIANPGEASLQAAAHPADTDYIFFVADGSGGHAFAATLAEHNRNVARWRRIEAEREKSGN